MQVNYDYDISVQLPCFSVIEFYFKQKKSVVWCIRRTQNEYTCAVWILFLLNSEKKQIDLDGCPTQKAEINSHPLLPASRNAKQKLTPTPPPSKQELKAQINSSPTPSSQQAGTQSTN